MKIRNGLWRQGAALAVCIMLVIGAVFISHFKRAGAITGASSPIVPRQLPMTLTPIFDSYPPPQTLAPNYISYPPPMMGISPSINTAYPAPEVGSNGVQQSYTPVPTFKPIPTESPTPTPIVMANGWYLYTDAEAGYSVSYPPESYLNSGKRAGAEYRSVTIGFHLPGVLGYQAMQIIVYPNPDNLPLEDVIYKQIFQNNFPKISLEYLKSMMKATITAGLPSMTITIPPLTIGIPPYQSIVLIPIENKVFFAAPSPNMEAGNPPDPEAVKLFYKIMETFTITTRH